MKWLLRIAAMCLLFLPALTSSPSARAAIVCHLAVPDQPLSAQGLATPWRLQAPCHESDSGQAVFVQAVVFDLDTHALSTYSPLVVDQGTTPAVAPVLPVLPAHAIVGLFGGGNDDVTILDNPGTCVNGADGQAFGQVFFCGAAQLFAAINAAHISIPPLGVGNDGLPCPTVRSFAIVDQDQSDNVQSTYLSTSSGQTAQNTAANRAALGSFTVMKNPSDNRVLSDFVGPALGCSSWLLPDLADNGALQPTQATNELQAAAYQSNPVALVPAGDPMTGPGNLDMVNAYRAGVDQKPIHALGQANTQAYCAHVRNTAPGYLAAHKTLFEAQPSPVAGAANLYDFLEGRLAATFVLLGCKGA